MYSRVYSVSILEHYFASKSFASFREVFSNAFPDKEVPNMTTTHGLIKFRANICLLKICGYFKHIFYTCSISFFLTLNTKK
jgi:hypothetical protein